MLRTINQLRALLKQITPESFTAGEVNDEQLIDIAAEHRAFVSTDKSFIRLDLYTIEDLENAYKEGFEAVVNDGKLLGFKKAV